MSENDKPSSLEDFDARLRKAREAHEPPDQGDGATSGMGLGFRVAIEMVVAVVFGAGLGWLLDEWLGTAPWLMVVFLPLGFAAGILNAYRVVTRSIAAGEGTKTEGDGDSPGT